MTHQPAAALTIVITSYNYGQYILDAVRSVQAQTYTHWQLLICDNGSTDGTQELLRPFLLDPRIQLVQREHNVGFRNNMAMGLDAVTTEFVSFLQADDFLTPHFAQATVSLLQKHAAAPFACAYWQQYHEETGKKANPNRTPFSAQHCGPALIGPFLTLCNFVPLHLAVFRTPVLKKFFPLFIDSPLAQVGEQFMLRMMEDEYGPGCYTSTLGGYWRRHEKQITAAHMDSGVVGIEEPLERLWYATQAPKPHPDNAFLALWIFLQISSRCSHAAAMNWLLSDAGKRFAARHGLAAQSDWAHWRDMGLAVLLKYATFSGLNFLPQQHLIDWLNTEGLPFDPATLRTKLLRLAQRKGTAFLSYDEIDTICDRLFAHDWKTDYSGGQPAAHTNAPQTVHPTLNGPATEACAPLFEIIILDDGDPARLEQSRQSVWRGNQGGHTPFALVVAKDWPGVAQQFAQSLANWVIVLRSGDELAVHALHMLAEQAMRMPHCVAMYADHKLMDAAGQIGTLHLKPGFSPDYFVAWDYVGPALALSRPAVNAAGGLLASDPSPLRAALLRLYAHHGAASIGHVAEVLWHIHPAPIRRALAVAAGTADGQSATQEIGPQARAEPVLLADAVRLVPAPPASPPTVLVVVQACADLSIMQRLLTHWQTQCSYGALEVVIFAADDLPAATLAGLQDMDAQLPAGWGVLSHPAQMAPTARLAMAMAHSTADVILCLRPDVEPLQLDWVEQLVALAMRPDVALVAPRLLDLNGHVVGNALLLGMANLAQGLGHGQAYDDPGYFGRLLTPQNPTAISPDAVMWRRAVCDAVGGLDTELGLYAALMDMALRMKSAGYVHVWTPHVTLACLSTLEIEITMADEALLMQRWLPQLARDPAYPVGLSRKSAFAPLERWQLVAPCLPGPTARPRLMALASDLQHPGTHSQVLEPLHAAVSAGHIEAQIDFSDISPYECAAWPGDVLYLQRPCSAVQTPRWRSYLRTASVKLVHNIDHLASQVPATPTHSAFSLSKDAALAWSPILELCERLIVSSEPLQHASRHLGADIRVLPPYLDRGKWGGLVPQRQQGGKLRVGWVGQPDQTDDLALITELVQATAHEVDWVFMGYCPDPIKHLAQQLLSGVALQRYPARLASLGLDVAIAPLQENERNDCLNHIRLLEHGVLGCPVIASDFGPYRRAAHMPGLTLVNNKPADWLEALRSHAHDPAATARCGAALRSHVLEHHMLQDHLEPWLRAWLD